MANTTKYDENNDNYFYPTVISCSSFQDCWGWSEIIVYQSAEVSVEDVLTGSREQMAEKTNFTRGFNTSTLSRLL